jgi:hypothetical protein
MDQPARVAALSWEAVFGDTGDTYDQRSRPEPARMEIPGVTRH